MPVTGVNANDVDGLKGDLHSGGGKLSTGGIKTAEHEEDLRFANTNWFKAERRLHDRGEDR